MLPSGNKLWSAHILKTPCAVCASYTSTSEAMGKIQHLYTLTNKQALIDVTGETNPKTNQCVDLHLHHILKQN